MCEGLFGHSNLVTRVNSICDMYGISMLRYICNDGYANKRKTEIKGFVKCDGMIDSISFYYKIFLMKTGKCWSCFHGHFEVISI